MLYENCCLHRDVLPRVEACHLIWYYNILEQFYILDGISSVVVIAAHVSVDDDVTVGLGPVDRRQTTHS